jgi:hypothetical protein
MTEPRPSPPPALRYFVRDDDIGELTDELTTFVNAFLARRIPVSYQIIPARLTSDCARFLLDVERDHPDLIEFGQHGLHHAMTVRGKRLKREFGPERSLEDQCADIGEGLRLLRERLGADRAITLFTPPQHKFDRNTVTAASRAGHRVFSAAYYSTPHHQLAYALGRGLGLSSIAHHGISYHGGVRPEAPLREISIAVAVDDGRGVRCPADQLPAAMTAAAARSDLVGLMFHHAVYQGAEGRSTLGAIVERLATYPASAFHRLGDLAQA